MRFHAGTDLVGQAKLGLVRMTLQISGSLVKHVCESGELGNVGDEHKDECCERPEGARLH